MDYMWADNGWGPTNISQPEYGLHKRVGIIQVMHKIAGPHPDLIFFIFCWTGKGISEVNKMAYPNNLCVYWQKKAWAGGNFCREWSTWKLFQISITWTEKLTRIIVSSCLTASCTDKWLKIKSIYARRLLMYTICANLLTTYTDLPHLMLDLAQT